MRHTESTGISLDTAADQIAALVQGIRRFFTRGVRGAAGVMKPL